MDTYTIPTNVIKLSDYCFANCKELTKIKGLENIKEYGKGCFFNCPKLYDFDKSIFKCYKPKTEYKMLTVFQKEQLEEWTSMKCSDIVFDSNIDDWSTSLVLNEIIIGKKRLTFLIEDKDGEIFGYYLNTKIIEKQRIQPQVTDSKSFHFNLQSPNNRLPNPIQFKIKDFKSCGYLFLSRYLQTSIKLGDIDLTISNWKNGSYCCQNESIFDYHGIENALCGKTHPKTIKPKRILVIQMK